MNRHSRLQRIAARLMIVMLCASTLGIPAVIPHAQAAAPPGTINIAQGKPATQSSNLNGTYLAPNAVDGNTDGNILNLSTSHTNNELQAWWQVDLQGVYFIDTITLWNRTDCCSDRLSNFDVLTSQDGLTWTTFYYPGTAPTTTNFAINANARYVKVQLRGTNALQLAEVQVWTGGLALLPPVEVDEGQTATNTKTYQYPGAPPVTHSVLVGSLTQTQTLGTALNVLGYWQLGEDDSGAANGVAGNSSTGGRDASGLNSSRNLGRNGNPVYVSPFSSNSASTLAVSFDGIDDGYVAGQVTTVINNFGIEAWVKPATSSTSQQLIVHNGAPFNGDGYGLEIRNGRYYGEYGSSRSFDTGVTATPGVWHHLALVRASGVTSIYIDGAEVYQSSIAAPSTPNQGSLAIGRAPNGLAPFKGLVDDVRIFTFASGAFNSQDLLYNESVSGSWSWSYSTGDGPAQSQDVTITASTGVSGSTPSHRFPLVVNNVAPTATFANGGPVSVGSTGSVSFAGQSDPSATDTAAGFHYAYDFDNNGSFDLGDGSYAGSGTAVSATVPASFLTTSGAHTIGGRIIDKDGGFSNYTTTITVTNTPPVAANDSYGTTRNKPLFIDPPGVLANDTDADGNTLTAAVASQPTHGALLLTSDGAFNYIPADGFIGKDSFTYTASDGLATSNTATVTITVQAGIGLLGYWQFDEGAGNTAADTSGSVPPNNATLASGAVFTTTAAPITEFANPGSLSVAGTTASTASVPNSAINRLTNTFSVMGWVKPGSLSGYQRIIATARTSSNNGWGFGLLNSSIIFSTVGKKDYTSPTLALKTGQWYHIAAVMDSSNAVSFYINGQFVSTVTGTAPASADPDDTLLIGASTASGGSTPTELFKGQIDDLRVYNRALSGAEVAAATAVTSCSEAVLRGKILVGERSGTITLDGACTYPLTFTETSGNGLVIASATTLEGNGATIERSANAPAFRILNVNTATPALAIRNLTLRGGKTTGNGAGLNSDRDLALTNTRFENNAGGTGGALVATKNLTVEHGLFLGNKSTANGGALAFTGPSGRITNSVFVNNNSGGSGAAIRSGDKSNLRLLNNTFTDQYKNPDEAVLINGPATVQNNIFENFKMSVTAAGLAAVVSEDYNLSASNEGDPRALSGATLTRGGHDRTAISPRFVDRTALNYRLQQNSPAVDLGTNAGVGTDADGNTRPYTGSGVDIGAYEYQGTGVPSLGIAKAGPPFAAAAGQTQFLLTVVNESTSPLNDLRLVEQLPAGAALVPGSISDGGSLSGGTLTWNLPALAPNQIERVTYQVTTTQTLVSDQYRVSSISNPAITASGPALTTPYTTTVATLGFLPFPDGYSFANYSAGNDSDVSANDIAFIFGADKVCKTQNPCVLTASAEAYRQGMVSAGGGHCFGMALASLWIYDRPEITPGQYQAGAEITYDLLKVNSTPLIQLFFSTQNQTPVSTTLPPLRAAEGATAAVDVLKANFANPLATDRYGISFQKPDKTGGHAVTPYAVRQIDADTYWIYVYDNNTPNNFDRVFKVTYSTGAWVYEGGSTSPDAPPSTYYNDGSDTKRFWLTSLRYHESFPKKCTSACAPGQFGKTAPISGTVLAQTTSATLSWQASETATGYDYCYSTTTSCSNWKTVKTLSAAVSGLTPNTTYYWQVRAYNGSYTYADGKNTAYWSFKTAAAAQANTLMGPLLLSAAWDGDQSLTLASDDPPVATGSYDFQLEGEGYLLITRSDGKRAGTDPSGQFIAEIPGAEEIDTTSGLGLNIPNILRIPHEPGMTYSISISDRENAYGNLAAPADLTIIGPGVVVRLKGLKIDSPEDPEAPHGVTDVAGVTFNPDNLRLGFTSSALDSDTPALNVAISQGGAPDYTFEVGGAVMPSGRTLSVGIDPTTGELVIENDDPADNSYSLDVERINLDGSKTSYRFDSLSDGTGIGAVVDLGPGWTGGAPTVGQNNPPASVADSYTTNAGTALAVDAPGVLRNDSGAGLTAALVAGPAHGTLTLDPNGAFTYTPASGYAGNDSFTYKANSGLYSSNVATVSITVNAPPVAANDTYTAQANTALTIGAPGVLGNDSDAEGSPLTAVLVAGPAHGSLTLNPNGSFTYTPASGYVGSDSFTYTAGDGTAVSNEATVSIAVRYAFTGFFAPVDNPPALNKVNGGQNIAVKFSLGSNFGLGILASGYPVSQQINCTTGALIGSAEPTTSNQGLTYAGGQYSYGWKTEKSWDGTCRLFTLRLADGTDHTALFKFKGNAYANAVAPGTNPLVLNSANAVGTSDGLVATIVSLLNGGLVLDMGAGEEGIDDLTVHYSGLSVGINTLVDFLDANGNLISSGQLHLLNLSVGTHAANVSYSSAQPYRYVRLRGVLLAAYQIDAIEATELVTP